MRRPRVLLALIVLTAPTFIFAQGRQAQPPAAPAVQTPAVPAGGRGGGAPLEISTDRTGWTSMFDGVSLKGWDGPMPLWHVENGAIVVRRTVEQPSIGASAVAGRSAEGLRDGVRRQARGRRCQQRRAAARRCSAKCRPRARRWLPYDEVETHGYQADMTNTAAPTTSLNAAAARVVARNRVRMPMRHAAP